MSEEDDIIKIIEAQMNKGVSRLKVTASENLSEGEIKQQYHHGRCDVGSPFAKGTVGNCDAVDTPAEEDL